MKKLFLLLVVIFITTICNAQIEVRKDEGLGYVPINEFPKANFTTSPEALKYSLSFDEAIANPGKKILVEDCTKILKLKPLFKKQVEVNNAYIVYKNQTNNIDFIRNAPKKKEEPSYYVLLSIMSILLMLISSALFKKGYNDGARLVAFVAICFAGFDVITMAAAFVYLGIIRIAFYSAVFSTLAGIIAFVAYSLNKKINKVSLVIFYILMVAHIVLLFV
jgi:hypothetical protein